MSLSPPAHRLKPELKSVLHPWSACCTVLRCMRVTDRKFAAKWVFAALLAIAAPACGDEDNDAATAVGVEVFFSIRRGGQRTSCAAGREFERVEAVVYQSDGLTPLANYPVEVDCSVNGFTLVGLSEGDFVLEIRAVGIPSGDPDAVLFRAREAFQFPRARPLDLELLPEVVFLDLAWTFGNLGSAPCFSEVGQVGVTLESVTSASSFSAEFGCSETPVRVARPFPAGEYTIEVEARSAFGGDVLFIHKARRFFVNGDNPYLAVLEPLGGRLNLDWRFAVGADEFTACDAEAVAVTTVGIEVVDGDGNGPSAAAAADCTDAPFEFPEARYTQGRLLSVILRAEGMHRFEGREDFEMPSGDYDSGRLTLHAVGTATLAITVRTATCAEDDVLAYAVTAEGPTDFSDQLESFAPDHPFAGLAGLRYGSYVVEVAQLTADGVQCAARGERRIRFADNAWLPFEF